MFAVKPSIRSVGVSRRANSVRVNAYEYVPAEKVGYWMNDKGYQFVDLRTPEENAEGARKAWKNIPVGVNTPNGPRLNGRFKATILEEFPNKMSRVLLACDDGTERTEIAAEIFEECGYTAVKLLDGGILSYLEKFPLTAEDLKPAWRLTGQASGVRYSFNEGKGVAKGGFDDGA